MRLGVVGLMSQNFRTVTQIHLEAIRALSIGENYSAWVLP